MPVRSASRWHVRDARRPSRRAAAQRGEPGGARSGSFSEIRLDGDQPHEKGSEIVIALAESGEPIGTAEIAYAEVFSDLTRKRRSAELSEVNYRSARERFEEGVTFVAADTRLLQAAKGEGLQTLNPEG